VAEAIRAVADFNYEDIAPGQIYEVERTFAPADLLAFAQLSGDFSPLHVDAAYAAETEFGVCVVHGMLLASLFSQLVGMRIPGRNALYLGQDLTFRRPIRVGETVRAVGKVTSKNDATRTISLAMEIRDAENKVAVAGTAKVKVRGASAPATVSTTATSASAAIQGGTLPVAIVTGASGGIGAEIARTLAAKGYAVALNYFRNEQRASEVVAEIRSQGGTAHAFQCDVRRQNDIAAGLAAVTQSLGSPSLLVNVATAELEQRPFAELGWEDFQAHLEYQVKAVVEFCQAVYPSMKAAGGGAIVNVLSQVTGGQPPAKMADYVTAKWALAGLSRALAVEWAEDQIRVNAVSPGLVQTPLTQHYHDRVFKMEAARTPLRRLATARDVASVVAYLASSDAAFLTGVNLFVSGGQIMM
jgi:3-oxoacyl-[acyl-carrier protein] reductase